jgi:CRP-like cAMP-binding protein
MGAIAAVAVEVEFPADHVIARQGEIGTGFFVIVSGGARVVRDGEAVATLGPGDFFGELSVLDGLPRIAQVVADGPTTCLALASWDFEALLLEEPRVSLALLRGLAGRLREVTEAQRH